jgi:hypothetical protein
VFGEVWNVSLWMILGCSLQVAIITCDPNEAILDNQLGENHVEVNILYCPNDIAIKTIRKWPLAQTIMDRYSLK